MADLDCRIVAMFALALSLLLLSSVLFIRHHYRPAGKTGHRSSAAIADGRDCRFMDCRAADTDDSDEYPTGDFGGRPSARPCAVNKTAPSEPRADFPMDESCLECLCEVLTGCRPAVCRGDVPCGYFKISLAYWTDAGRLTLSGGPLGPDYDEDAENEYERCVNNRWCAGRTVQAYMKRFARDCTDDGEVDCYDFASIHFHGPSGCKTKNLPVSTHGQLEQCLSSGKQVGGV